MTPRIGSLCSGAGALDTAVAAVFGATPAWHCEYNAAASKVLAHRFPGVPNHHDVTATDWDTVEPVDILTAGYPCQPFSTAGKRKGTNDERHLWPDVREAIRRLRPRITILENVAGHRSMGFDRVLGDLAEDGLHVRWTSVRASDVGSCHKRERLWILVTPNPGRLTVRSESVTEPRGGDTAIAGSDREAAGGIDLLPTPSAADGGGGHLSRSGDRRGELLLPGVARAYGNGDLSPTPAARDDDLPTALSLLPTPAAADGTRGQDFARAERAGSGGDDLVTAAVKATLNQQWGKYAPAIERWEALTRPSPSPTEPNTKGNPRLNPAFSEWMMGWAAGWATAVPGISREDQLRIIGNGVVPQQAEAAIRSLLSMVVVVAA